jgi:hypothetical protein
MQDQPRSTHETEAAAALPAQNGGRGHVISLPEELGIFGNTHLMMQDDNSDVIADLILDWLAANVARESPHLWSAPASWSAPAQPTATKVATSRHQRATAGYRFEVVGDLW